MLLVIYRKNNLIISNKSPCYKNNSKKKKEKEKKKLSRNVELMKTNVAIEVKFLERYYDVKILWKGGVHNDDDDDDWGHFVRVLMKSNNSFSPCDPQRVV